MNVKTRDDLGLLRRSDTTWKASVWNGTDGQAWSVGVFSPTGDGADVELLFDTVEEQYRIVVGNEGWLDGQLVGPSLSNAVAVAHAAIDERLEAYVAGEVS